MAFKLPNSKYFTLPISVWSHSLNAYEPWNATLGEFLSGEVFNQRRVKIKLKDFMWFFNPNPKNGNKPTIDPSLYSGIDKLLNGRTIGDAVNQLRSYVAIHGKDETVQAAKKLLPGATVSAQFARHRAKKAPHVVNNMIALDIDNVDVPVTIQKLNSLNICFWICPSITGTGVFCLVPLSTNNLIGHFESLNLLMQENGIALDPLKDATRLRYWSPPEDAIINLNVLPYDQVYYVPKEIKMYRGTKESPIYPLGKTNDYDTDDYAKACHRKGLKNASKNLNLPEGEIGEHLHTFIKYYHWAFNHYGISLKYAVSWAWEYFFASNPYILQKDHQVDRIEKDFTLFYNSYASQHHLFDFELQKQSSMGSETYDLHLILPHGQKLNSLQLPLISQAPISDNLETKAWSGWKRYLLDSPTNSGKTSTFTRHFISNNIKGLIVVPTQGALEQLKHDYPQIKVYYEKAKDVKESDLLICTTYSSFEKVCKIIDPKKRFIVVDEFHNVVLSSSKGYRNRELNIILDRIDQFNNAVLMTGTNLKCHHPILTSFKKVKVSYANDAVKHLQVVYHSSKNRMQTLLHKMCTYRGLQVLYLDNKKETGELGRLIEGLKQAGFSEDEIQLANADQKSELKYQEMIETGRVDAKVRVIIATKIFVEALNLYDNVDAFHILSTIHGAYMQQLVTRPRKNTQCDVYLYWHENSLVDRDKTEWFDQERYYQGQIRLAENLLKAYEETEWDDIHRMTFTGNEVLRKRRVSIVTTDDGLNAPHESERSFILDYDYLNCDFNTQELQMLLYKRNPDQLFEYLKQYNWKIKQEDHSNCLPDQMGTMGKARLEEGKEKAEKELGFFILELIMQGSFENHAILDEKSYEKEAWKVTIRKRYALLAHLLEEADANEILSKVRDNKRSFDVIIRQIKIRQALRFGRSDTRNFAEILFDTFPINSTWTSQRVFETIVELQKATLPSLKPIGTPTAATQLLNLYVETDRCKVIDPNGTPPKGRKHAFKNALKIVSHHPIRRKDGDAIEPIVGREEKLERLDRKEVAKVRTFGRTYREELRPLTPELMEQIKENPDYFLLKKTPESLDSKMPQ